jgi:hypothetical protein
VDTSPAAENPASQTEQNPQDRGKKSTQPAVGLRALVGFFARSLTQRPGVRVTRWLNWLIAGLVLATTAVISPLSASEMSVWVRRGLTWLSTATLLAAFSIAGSGVAADPGLDPLLKLRRVTTQTMAWAKALASARCLFFTLAPAATATALAALFWSGAAMEFVAALVLVFLSISYCLVWSLAIAALIVVCRVLSPTRGAWMLLLLCVLPALLGNVWQVPSVTSGLDATLAALTNF